MIAKNDNEFQRIIKERDFNNCQFEHTIERSINCVNTGLNAHHIIYRRYSTRLDTRIGILLCSTCHSFAHENPKESEEMAKNILIFRCIIKDDNEWQEIKKSAKN